jgi:glutathione synthase/RimK-type ligase-like ATP-grasp enzyme
VKALSSGTLDDYRVSYTTEILGWSDGFAEEIAVSPHLFQAQIFKAADVRVTIVDERVFACRILSQTSEDTRVDFRRFRNFVPAHLLIDLPSRLERALIALVQRLGLRYGAVDLVEDVEGSYWFLEVNPNGQWGWIEQLTGAPISSVLADALDCRINVCK